MWERAVEVLGREWAVIRQAPVSFATAVLVLGACLWGVMQWGYGRQISLLDQQLQDARRQLGLTPRHETAFTVLRNDQLKVRANNTARWLRVRARRTELEAKSLFFEHVGAIIRRPSPLELERSWSEYAPRDALLADKAVAEYRGEMQAEAVGCRDELLRRLGRAADPGMRRLYEEPASRRDLEMVAASLDELVATLKDIAAKII